MTKNRHDNDGFKHTYGPIFKWVACLPCFVCGAWPSTPHHVRTVGSGGRDYGNLVDVCIDCHSAVHSMGEVTFQYKKRVDLQQRATDLVREYPSWLRVKASNGKIA